MHSPVRPEIIYDEEMVCCPFRDDHSLWLNVVQELQAESISFGVLTKVNTMMVMKTRESMSENGVMQEVKLILNLRRKEIEVRFPSVLSRKQAPFYKKNPQFKPEYRFTISLDEEFQITQVHGSDNKISFVLQLDMPPPFSKKQHEKVVGTHKHDARRWLENDVWLRQTTIASHDHNPGRRSTAPISLEASDSTISIGRWTTYRITFKEAARDFQRFRIVSEALRDFNVQIFQASDFDYVAPIPPVWDFLDKHLRPAAMTSPSWAEELAKDSTYIVLPFSVRYLLDVCISSGRLNEYVVRENFLIQLSAAGEAKACNKLKNILDLPQGQKLHNPVDVFDNKKFRPVLRKELKVPDNYALLHSATVTATTIIFHAPSVEITNRIIRQYKPHADRFLRVRFEDDKYRGNSKIYSATTNRNDAIFDRVKHTLTCGITLGDRKYEFLAWGNSQLREHSAYFFASLAGVVTASQIRAVMGHFDHEKIIAKRAARMGQCFSTTRPIRYRVPRVTRLSLIPDVERNGFTFTDGVGKISPLLADMVYHQLRLLDRNKISRAPSVFQFRLGGCKGVLAVSEDLKGIDLRLRNSQFKFSSESNELEVIRWSSRESAHLNRQLILVLSALGVGDEVFLRMQDKVKRTLEAAMSSDEVALYALRREIDANHITPDIADMVENGFRAANEPFVTSLLQLWRTWSLKYLKEKAKLKVENGACLLGCVDETSTLCGHYNDDQPAADANYAERFKKLPEVFVQVQLPKRDKDEPPKWEIKEGICIIARNPSLHEGDIRVVRAVNVPALSHLRDVLVLPQTGDRDLANMCSGGDLDGDDYIVIWAEDLQNKKFDLLPKIWNAEPMDYTAPKPVRADGDVTLNHIIDFFDQYMRNDFLGRIAHAHLGWADDLDDGIRSEQCLKLASLHSQAVDFPKTGVPAKLPRALDRFEWPHFMEKKGGKPYKSRKVLGKLYDDVKLIDFIPNFRGKFDERILNAQRPSEEVSKDVEELKRGYDTSIRRIMAQHDIGTEFEVWSTFVLDHSKASPDFKFHEEIGNLSTSLKDEFHEAIVELAGGRDHKQLIPYAVAAYQLVKDEVEKALESVPADTKPKHYHKHMPFISFPWVLQDTLGIIAKTASQTTVKRQLFSQDGDVASNDTKPVSHNFQGEQYPDPAGCTETSYSEDVTSSTESPKGVSLLDLAASSRETERQLAPISSTAEQFSRVPSVASLLVRPDVKIDTSSAQRVSNANLLDDDGNGLDVLSSVMNGRLRMPEAPTAEQWNNINNIIDSPVEPSTGGASDALFHVSGDFSALSSKVVNLASRAHLGPSSYDKSSADHQPQSSARLQTAESTFSRSAPTELAGPSCRPAPQLSEDGHYMSPHRHRSKQSGSSGSRQSSLSKASPATAQPGERRGGSGLHSSLLMSSPGRTLHSPLPFQKTTIPETTQRQNIGAKFSFVPSQRATAIRTETDSDDEGEVVVYGDPAGMAL